MIDFTKPNVPKNYEPSQDYVRRLGQAVNRMLDDSFISRMVASVINGASVNGNMVSVVPNYTTTQRDALTPFLGQIIYNTTLNKHQGYNGTWNNLY